ncbi:MAG: Gfo/Idh/MocA family protein [Acidimicrobiales bacterium]
MTSSDVPALGIGVIGAGLIVSNAHLPAYRKAGFDVRAIFDVDQNRASSVADTWDLDVCRSLDELLARDDIDVIDIAVTPTAQQSLARAVLESGRHALAQKPLAHTLPEAEALVQTAAASRRCLAVNQQMRWAPSVKAMKAALREGTIGEPVLLSYRLNIAGEYPPDHWLSHEERYMASFGTIHYVDSARYLFGEPEKVTARLLTDRVQNATGETFINSWLEWPNGPVFVGFERYTNRTEDEPVFMRLEGTEGVVKGTLGLYVNYPDGASDLVERMRYGGSWEIVDDEGRWLPDAFSGPMLGLMNAILTDTEPPTSAADNLGTLRIVEALYRSNAEGRSIYLSEIG